MPAGGLWLLKSSVGRRVLLSHTVVWRWQGTLRTPPLSCTGVCRPTYAGPHGRLRSGEAKIVVLLASGMDIFANLDTVDQFTNSRG